MILVTGGTGLVGSHLLLELTGSGNNVRATHRKNSDLGAVKNIFSCYFSKDEASAFYKKIEWVEADLNDIPSLKNAFKGITEVYHCAALVSFDSSKADALRKINIEGTANIVNICVSHRVEKLCYLSSIATMGLSPGETSVTENFTWHPEKDHTEYAISKHGAEIEVWRGSQEGVPVIILNPGVIIGPGNWEKGSGQIFKKVDNGLKFHFPKITGFVGVKDVACAAVTAMKSSIENEQFIVVAENLKFSRVLQMVAESLGKPAPGNSLKPWMVSLGWIFQLISNRLFGTKKLLNRHDRKRLFEDTYYSNRKIIETFNLKFTPVKEAIKETAEIYRKGAC